MGAVVAQEVEASTDLRRGRRRGSRRHWLILALLVAGTAGAAVEALAPEASAIPMASEGKAPEFVVAPLGGEAGRLTLEQFRGRPLVLNFWGSWCVPCRKEMPTFGRVAEQLNGRVAFVGINHQDDATAAREFLSEVGDPYISGLDPTGDVARRYGVQGLPTTILVDARGQIVGRRLGELSEEELRDSLQHAFGGGT